MTTVLDSASTMFFLTGFSVLMRLVSLLFSPTRLLTSGTVVVEIECLLVKVELEEEGLRSDDKEVEVVVLTVVVVADVSVEEADTVSPPFSWTDFFSVAV